ncbi:hypothetical protein HWV62_17244 [Athelia sp. TMB]|nr:hypothetical protein HWV62_17244 [Athelia sp. TMB]
MGSIRPPLDLHSIAVLINYERTSGPNGDYRFRHTKLRDMTTSGSFSTLLHPPEWFQAADRPKRGFLFRTEKPRAKDSPGDTPDNMVSSDCSQSVAKLTKDELSTIFWEVRGHNGCYDSISIFQNLADLLPSGQTMRVRAPNGTDFITEISNRVILEYYLDKPKQATLSIVMPHASVRSHNGKPVPSQFRYTGEADNMKHSVWGFCRPNELEPAVILDLASMQFGGVGRGRSGDFFILDSPSYWEKFAGKIAQGLHFRKQSDGINPADDEEREAWFMAVAKRVKERWEARDSNHWCALCGKPDVTQRCSRCAQDYYCSDAHCLAAWKGWHKKWCVPKTPN